MHPIYRPCSFSFDLKSSPAFALQRLCRQIETVGSNDVDETTLDLSVVVVDDFDDDVEKVETVPLHI